MHVNCLISLSTHQHLLWLRFCIYSGSKSNQISTWTCHFWLKHVSSIHKIASFSEKSSGLNQVRNMYRSSTAYKMLIDEWCGLLWCFYQLFGLSFWWHPFTAEHPLMSKWCNATFPQICSHEKTNSSTSWMTWVWVNY